MPGWFKFGGSLHTSDGYIYSKHEGKRRTWFRAWMKFMGQAFLVYQRRQKLCFTTTPDNAGFDDIYLVNFTPKSPILLEDKYGLGAKPNSRFRNLRINQIGDVSNRPIVEIHTDKLSPQAEISPDLIEISVPGSGIGKITIPGPSSFLLPKDRRDSDPPYIITLWDRSEERAGISRGLSSVRLIEFFEDLFALTEEQQAKTKVCFLKPGAFNMAEEVITMTSAQLSVTKVLGGVASENISLVSDQLKIPKVTGGRANESISIISEQFSVPINRIRRAEEKVSLLSFPFRVPKVTGGVASEKIDFIADQFSVPKNTTGVAEELVGFDSDQFSVPKNTGGVATEIIDFSAGQLSVPKNRGGVATEIIDFSAGQLSVPKNTKGTAYETVDLFADQLQINKITRSLASESISIVSNQLSVKKETGGTAKENISLVSNQLSVKKVQEGNVALERIFLTSQHFGVTGKRTECKSLPAARGENISILSFFRNIGNVPLGLTGGESWRIQFFTVGLIRNSLFVRFIYEDGTDLVSENLLLNWEESNSAFQLSVPNVTGGDGSLASVSIPGPKSQHTFSDNDAPYSYSIRTASVRQDIIDWLAIYSRQNQTNRNKAELCFEFTPPLPPNPPSLTATDIKDVSISVEATPATKGPRTRQYSFRIGTVSNDEIFPSFGPWSPASKSKIFLFDSLTPKTTYYIQARAHNSGGASIPSENLIVTTKPKEQKPVTGTHVPQVNVSVGGKITTKLTGIDPTDAEAKLEIDSQVITNFASPVISGSGAERTIEWTGNSKGSETWVIVIEATNRKTLRINVVVNVSDCTEAPTAPTITPTSGISDISVAVFADAGGGMPDNFTVAIREKGQTTETEDTISPYVFNNLKSDTDYEVRAQASNACGDSPWTAWTTIKTKPELPTAPVLTIGQVTKTSIQTNVSRGMGGGTPTTFEVRIAEGNADDDLLSYGPWITAISGSYRFQGLTCNTEYAIQARALNISGSSPLSDDSATTSSCTITCTGTLTAKGPGNQTLKPGRYEYLYTATATGDYRLVGITEDPDEDGFVIRFTVPNDAKHNSQINISLVVKAECIKDSNNTLTRDISFVVTVDNPDPCDEATSSLTLGKTSVSVQEGSIDQTVSITAGGTMKDGVPTVRRISGDTSISASISDDNSEVEIEIPSSVSGTSDSATFEVSVDFTCVRLDGTTRTVTEKQRIDVTVTDRPRVKTPPCAPGLSTSVNGRTVSATVTRTTGTDDDNNTCGIETSYEIQFSTSQDDEGSDVVATLNEQAGTSRTVRRTLDWDTQYYVRARASNTDGDSPWSDWEPEKTEEEPADPCTRSDPTLSGVPSDVSLEEGDTSSHSVSATTGATISVSSDNTSVATVSYSNGRVNITGVDSQAGTGINTGKARISVTATLPATSICPIQTVTEFIEVTVTEPTCTRNDPTVDDQTVTVDVGETKTVSITFSGGTLSNDLDQEIMHNDPATVDISGDKVTITGEEAGTMSVGFTATLPATNECPVQRGTGTLTIEVQEGCQPISLSVDDETAAPGETVNASWSATGGTGAKTLVSGGTIVASKTPGATVSETLIVEDSVGCRESEQWSVTTLPNANVEVTAIADPSVLEGAYDLSGKATGDFDTITYSYPDGGPVAVTGPDCGESVSYRVKATVTGTGINAVDGTSDTDTDTVVIQGEDCPATCNGSVDVGITQGNQNLPPGTYTYIYNPSATGDYTLDSISDPEGTLSGTYVRTVVIPEDAAHNSTINVGIAVSATCTAESPAVTITDSESWVITVDNPCTKAKINSLSIRETKHTRNRVLQAETGGVSGTLSYKWNTGQTTQAITINNPDCDTTDTYSVEVTATVASVNNCSRSTAKRSESIDIEGEECTATCNGSVDVGITQGNETLAPGDYEYEYTPSATGDYVLNAISDPLKPRTTGTYVRTVTIPDDAAHNSKIRIEIEVSATCTNESPADTITDSESWTITVNNPVQCEEANAGTVDITDSTPLLGKITLTANVTGSNGALDYTWTGGEKTQSIEVDEPDCDTVDTYNVEVVASIAASGSCPLSVDTSRGFIRIQGEECDDESKCTGGVNVGISQGDQTLGPGTYDYIYIPSAGGGYTLDEIDDPEGTITGSYVHTVTIPDDATHNSEIKTGIAVSGTCTLDSPAATDSDSETWTITVNNPDDDEDDLPDAEITDVTVIIRKNNSVDCVCIVVVDEVEGTYDELEYTFARGRHFEHFDNCEEWDAVVIAKGTGTNAKAGTQDEYGIEGIAECGWKDSDGCEECDEPNPGDE